MTDCLVKEIGLRRKVSGENFKKEIEIISSPHEKI
jgi:hypothetical protein